MRYLIKLIQKAYMMVDPREGERVMRNVLSLSSLQVITYILPIILLPYLFRTLGAEKFGLVAFASAFVQYFMILTDYGFSVSATKEISLVQDDVTKIRQTFSAVMTIKTIFAFLSLCILGVLVYCIPKFNSDWMLYAISFGVVVGNILFPTWFFQGTESMKYILKINLIGEFFYAAGIFYFIHRPEDYILVPLITSSVSLLVGMIGQYIVFTRFKVGFQFPKYDDLKRQLRAGWDVFISSVAINAYTTTRVFAVGLLTNNAITGYYSVAERIANAVQTFPLTSFTQAIFPRLTKIFQKNQATAFAIMEQIQSITIIISMICLPIVFFLAPIIVRLVCGGTYPEAVVTLKFLLIAVFFIASNAFRVQFLLVSGRSDLYSKIHVSVSLIGLPLIIIFISLFSYVGAAMATTLIEAGVLITTFLVLKRLSFKQP